MPFIAYKDGESVIPEQVDDGEDVRCRECLGRMRARGPFDDGTARHFYHVDHDRRGGGCSDGGPGESATHLKWKSMAVSGLRSRFDDYRVCAPEVPLDVSATETDVDERRADALLEFDERNRFYGNGIIVEVQHLNVSKDIRGTTHDYLELGYSVYWATEDDCDGDRFLVDRMEEAFNEDRRSAFSVYHTEPPRIDVPEPLPVLESEDVEYTRSNPRPECDHQFIPTRGGDSAKECVRCSIGADYCVYDEDQERLVEWEYEKHGSRSDYFLAVNLATVGHSEEVAEIEEYGDDDRCDHLWRGGRSLYAGGSKYKCKFCSGALIMSGDRIVLNHE